MKMTAKCLIARIFPAPKPYAVAILAAGQVVRLTITAATPELSQAICDGLRTNGFSSPVWMVTLLSVARMMRNSSRSAARFSPFQREQVNVSPTLKGCAAAAFSSAFTMPSISA